MSVAHRLRNEPHEACVYKKSSNVLLVLMTIQCRESSIHLYSDDSELGRDVAVVKGVQSVKGKFP